MEGVDSDQRPSLGRGSFPQDRATVRVPSRCVLRKWPYGFAGANAPARPQAGDGCRYRRPKPRFLENNRPHSDQSSSLFQSRRSISRVPPNDKDPASHLCPSNPATHAEYEPSGRPGITTSPLAHWPPNCCSAQLRSIGKANGN